jgi:phage terminase small subunit
LKQEAFVAAYLETGNASEAYRRAYDAKGMNAATINREAHALLEHPKIAPRLSEIRTKAAEQVALSKAWVLDRLMRHAQVCLGEVPIKLKMRQPRTSDVLEIETHMPDAAGANRALELLGKELSMFVDRKEVGGPGAFENLDDEELAATIAEQTRLLAEADPEFAAQLRQKRATKH